MIFRCSRAVTKADRAADTAGSPRVQRRAFISGTPRRMTTSHNRLRSRTTTYRFRIHYISAHGAAGCGRHPLAARRSGARRLLGQSLNCGVQIIEKSTVTFGANHTLDPKSYYETDRYWDSKHGGTSAAGERTICYSLAAH